MTMVNQKANRTIQRLDKALHQTCPDATIRHHAGIYDGRQGRPAVSASIPGLPLHLVVNVSINGKQIEAWAYCGTATRTLYKGPPGPWIRKVEAEGLGP